MIQCLFVCLLDELILGFCYSDLTLETGGFELASSIILVLQANRLTKCAERNWFEFANRKRPHVYNEFMSFQDIKDTDIMLKLIDATLLEEVQ